jgi:hypothetical protein
MQQPAANNHRCIDTLIDSLIPQHSKQPYHPAAAQQHGAQARCAARE